MKGNECRRGTKKTIWLATWTDGQISSHDYRKYKPSQLTLDMNGHLINITEGLKLLGVTADKDLHFSEQSASRLIGVLKRLRKPIPTEAKLQI